MILQNDGLDPIEEDALNEDHESTENQSDDIEDTYELFAGCEELEHSTSSLSAQGELDVSLGETGMLSKV
jgi:hypothetical protein